MINSRTPSRTSSSASLTTCSIGFEACFPRVRLASGSGWGRQPAVLEGAEAWLMPSTSGRAVAYRAHVHRVLAELGERLRTERLVTLRENIEA